MLNIGFCSYYIAFIIVLYNATDKSSNSHIFAHLYIESIISFYD